MAFGDVFAGWQEAAKEHYGNLLQMDYQNKRDLAAQYAKLAEDPRYALEQQQEFQKRALMIPTMEPMKKLPKEWENMTIQVKSPQMLQPPQQGAPQDQQLQAPQTGPLPQGMSGGQPPPPVYPPSMPAQMGETQQTQNLMQPMPFDWQMAHQRGEALAKGAPAITDTIIKSAMGNKIGQYPTVDPNTHEAYQMLRFRGVDPGSIDLNDLSKIKYREWEERSGLPLRPFAPRAVVGAGLTAEDVMNAVTQDVPLQFDHLPTPAEMAKVTSVLPNAKVIPVGPNQFYVAGQHWNKTVGADGRVMLFPDTPSASADPFHKYVDVGIPNQLLPRNTSTATQPPRVDPSTGLTTPGVTNRLQTVTVPGGGSMSFPSSGPRVVTSPGAPTPPPGPQAAPPAASPEAAKQAPLFGPQQAPLPPTGGVTAKQFEDAQKGGTGMRGIAQAISGDASSLENFAPLAANPQLRGQMAEVFQTLQKMLGETAGGDSNFNIALGLHFGLSGNLAQILGNVSGVNQAAITSEVNRIQNVLTQGITAGATPAVNQKAQNAVSSIMALFAVLPAMRNISGNPVYRASMGRLELEIPTMFNVGSAQEFYQKLGLISRELAVAGTNKDLQRYLGKDEIKGWEDMRDRFFAYANMNNTQLLDALKKRPNAPAK